MIQGHRGTFVLNAIEEWATAAGQIKGHHEKCCSSYKKQGKGPESCHHHRNAYKEAIKKLEEARFELEVMLRIRR